MESVIPMIANGLGADGSSAVSKSGTRLELLGNKPLEIDGWYAMVST